jgi:DNA-binding IscR family transcriptional regulator
MFPFRAGNSGPIAMECRLKFSFQKALDAFYDSLSNETLADLM